MNMILKPVNHLNLLIREKIRNHRTTYDYRKWNREWRISVPTTDSILGFMFGLDTNQGEEINYLRSQYLGVLYDFLLKIGKDKKLMLKFFRFYMSLPVFEYEYTSKYGKIQDLPPVKGSEQTGTFMLSMCNFDFKGNYIRVKDSVLKETMNEIFDDGVIDRGVLRRIIVHIDINEKSNEIDRKREQYILRNSLFKLFTPLRLLLEMSLNKSFGIDDVPLKDQESSEKSQSMAEVDLALYLPDNRSDLYSCVEFKRFPIHPEYFGPNGKFTPMDLFRDSEEKVPLGKIP